MNKTFMICVVFLQLGRNPIPEEAATAGVDYLLSLEELSLQNISLAVGYFIYLSMEYQHL